jgi:hypothetical protein
LARFLACAVFAKVLLLPENRKTAYYADFAGNCQWPGGYFGIVPDPISPQRRRGRKVTENKNNISFDQASMCFPDPYRNFSVKHLIFFACSAPLRLS